jgi:predicted methyltransferase
MEPLPPKGSSTSWPGRDQARKIRDQAMKAGTEAAQASGQAVAERDQAVKDNVRQVETVPGEPTDTKLAPESVDAALVCDVLHHVPADLRPGLLKNVAAAVKPGGFLFIVDWRVDSTLSYDRDRRIPRDDLLNVATAAGFVFDAEFHYLKHQVFLRFRKPEPPK